MKIDSALIETLLHMPESNTLDFKQKQYPFAGVTDEAKSELIKDILAFANAWKASDAFIVIGVEDGRGQRGVVHGVAEQLDDASVQQLVNGKTNVPVAFEYIPTMADGMPIALIRIAKDQQRPIYLKRRCGPLDAKAVFIRRGSSTAEASPEEIAKMGAPRELAEEPQLALGVGDPNARSSMTSPIRLAPLVARSSPRRDAIKAAFAKTAFAAAMPSFRVLGEPSEEEVRNARRNAALFTKMAFSVRNTGRVLLRDVRIVAAIPAVDGVRLLDKEPLRKPKNLYAFDLVDVRFPGDTTISRRGDVFEVTARVGKIQPQDTVWSDPFWMGGETACFVAADVKVFADNLPSPVAVPFEFVLAPVDVFDEDLPDGEEDHEDDQREDRG